MAKYVCRNKKCKNYDVPTEYKSEPTKCKKCKLKPEPHQPSASTIPTDIRGDRIEPDPKKDSLKLCIYHALSNGQGTDKGWKDVIDDTAGLRKTYKVAFDEDEWIPALAEFYEYSTLATDVIYGKVISTCTSEHSAKAGSDKEYKIQFFVIAKPMGEAAGHALYIECNGSASKQTFMVIDNENVGTTDKIAAKFSGNKFDIYSRLPTAQGKNLSRDNSDRATLVKSTERLSYLAKNKE